MRLTTLKTTQPLGPEGVRQEVARLASGGEMDEPLIEGLSNADRVSFEVAVIDALTTWPRAAQRRLRATLIKHGYDEVCARRKSMGDIPDQVRASTIYRMIRPQQLQTGNLDIDMLPLPGA